MFKLLKWDLLDLCKKYIKPIIVMLIFMFVTLLIPEEMLKARMDFNLLSIMAIIVTLGTFVIFVILLFVGIGLGFSRVIDFFKKETKYLKLSTPIESWKLVLEKLISFTIIYLVSIGFGKMFSFIYEYFKADSPIKMQVGIDVWQMLVSVLVLVSIFMFSAFMSKSFKTTRVKWKAYAFIIFILTMIVFSYLENILYILAGANYSVVGYISFVIDSSNLSTLTNNVIYYLAQAIPIIALFFINVKLLKDKVEV